jgi:transposase
LRWRMRMRPEGSGRELERRRQRAIALLKERHAPVEVARLLGVDRRSVRRWNAAYRKQGAAGLAARAVPGRPFKLSIEQRAQLESMLLRGAAANGFESDLWTCPRVAQVIARRFGIRYHVDHIGRLLRSLGWTPQRPTRRALERDEEGIQRWIKQQWPRIKNKPGS